MIIDTSRTVKNVMHEDITIKNSSKVKFDGITNGTIKICDCSTCNIVGLHNGDIIVESNCNLSIHGLLNGNVTNYGNTEIFGVVNNATIKGNKPLISDDAIINDCQFLSE